jgi:hypothetical protein
VAGSVEISFNELFSTSLVLVLDGLKDAGRRMSLF